MGYNQPEIELEDLSDAITDALREYSNGIRKKVDTITEQTSNTVKKELKETSPKRNGKGLKRYKSGKSYKSGAYAKAWTSSVVYNVSGNKRIVIGNKQHYYLTHLLEYGHATRNGGRARAIPHIKPVEEKAIKEFEEKIAEAIQSE